MSQRDPSGPDHRPEIYLPQPIDGVVVQRSPVVEYSEGFLTELYRPEWIGVFGEDEPVEHLYAVFAPRGGTRTEWYYHQHTLDRYMLVHGGLEIGLYDGRETSPTYEAFTVVSLRAHTPDSPNSIRIPPGVWHSLRWTTPEGLFVNAKLPGFNREVVDKFRVPMSELPPAISWTFQDFHSE